jgi:hypothetical protein
MITVEMNLCSAISASRDANLCRLEIVNDGATETLSRGNYDVRLYARNNGRLVRTARVENWPRNARPAWRLLAAAMAALEVEA